VTTRHLGRLALIATLVVGVLAACGDEGDEEVAVSGVSGPVVTAKNTAFDPTSLRAKVGETITFENEDSIDHTVTPDRSGDFSGGNLKAGDALQVAISKEGVFAFHCSIHPSMKGVITVT
jgi:plastocyanin